MVNKLCLEILGTSMTITAEEDQSYLQKVLTQYKAAVENTQIISGIKEPINIAVLTGFLLCDEINKIKQLKQIEEIEAGELEQRANNMITILEQATKTFRINKSETETNK